MTDAFIRETPDVHDDGAGVPAFAAGTSERAITATSPGYTYFTDYKGNRWLCCTCMKEFLTYAQQLAIKKGLLKQGFDVWQLTGSAAASAGTHEQGGAFDLLLQTSDAWVKFFRDLGATATWRRTTAQGFTKQHLHGVLNGCPHNAPARYQVTEQKSGPPAGGGDGLTGTRPDYHPDPSPYRTWQQGVTEMKRLLGLSAVTAQTTLSITPQSNVTGAFSLLRGRTPTLMPGTHVYEYEAAPGVWKEFKRITPVGGNSSFYHSFGGTHGVRLRYVPADPLKSKPTTSGVLQVRTYNLATQTAQAAKVPALEKEIVTLKARIAELEKPKDDGAPPADGPALGVDVSGHQTISQVQTLAKDASVAFVLAKASEGQSWKSADYGLQRAELGSKIFGAYHFAWPNQDPAVEAGNFLTAAALKSGELAALDLERATAGESWVTRVRYAVAWLERVSGALNCTPLVYVNWTWIKGLRDAASVTEWDQLVRFPLWLAEWSGVPGQFSTVDPKAGSTKGWPVLVHQYGVVDEVDRNWVGSLAALKAVTVK